MISFNNNNVKLLLPLSLNSIKADISFIKKKLQDVGICHIFHRTENLDTTIQ